MPAKACAKSAIKSSLSSKPQDILTKPAGMPQAASCSSVIWRWVLVAGFKQQVRASATWVSMAAILRRFIKASAALRPPFKLKETTPQPPLPRYFSAKAW